MIKQLVPGFTAANKSILSRLTGFLANPLLVLLLFSIVSCDIYGQDDFVEQYVVESYLIANQIMPEVRLSTTAPFNDPYYFEERAVPGALVRIHRYNENGDLDRTYQYEEQDRGVYLPVTDDQMDEVMPRLTYRLEIEIPDDNNHRIEAETSVPDTFSVREIIRDRAYYQSQDQLEFTITRNRTNDRQNYFIYATESLDPAEENMTQFWKDIIDDYETARRIRTSIVNEENFNVNPDGTITLRMPWIGIAFYGPNIISTYSIDDNSYDFFRSQLVQVSGGGSSISPGEIQNLIYHVDGAIGLFGSMSVLDINVIVDRPDN